MDDTSDPAPDTTPADAGDDRKTAVDPASDPHPMNPPLDDEAVEKGKDTLDRVKPY